jgi:hypothetical protein
VAPPPSPSAFTAYSLPRDRRPQGPAALLALLIHGAIALLVLWRGALLFQPGVGAAGPPGGGGGAGGGRPALVWFALSPASAPQVHDVPAPSVTAPAIVAPDPVKIEVPAPLPTPPPETAAPTGTSAPTTGATGQGSGTDGGRGTGTGGGVGSAAGPDSGGEGGYIFPANPTAMVPPPSCARGEFKVRFSVEATGRVSRVEVNPLPKEAGCRREMMEILRAFKFQPARTRDGRVVASIFLITITQ